MKRIFGIFGATSSGKSLAASVLAKTKKFKIINADSQQIYMGLDTLAAVEKMPGYSLYSFLNQKINAIEWAKLALYEIELAFSENLIPVLVGGTGLYFKLMQDGIVDLPKIMPDIAKTVSAYSVEELKARLPEHIAAKFTDKRRLERALGIFLQTNKHIDFFFAQRPSLLHNYDLSIFALALPREVLWKNIENRIDAIFPKVIEEVRNFNGESDVIGFDEIKHFISNGAHKCGDLENLKELLCFKTRQYAKRQKTFMRQLKIDAVFEDYQLLLDHILKVC